MENKSLITSSAPGTPVRQDVLRRKRRNDLEIAIRYFLPKPGSSPASPELGQEVASEGEALIQSFKSGQTFFTVAVWKAIPEVDSGGRPMIVKQVATQK
jgi:hypothetical protein